MKWFTPHPQSVEQLKKLYKKLAMKHHPDIGGAEADMKEINSEYDQLFEQLKNIHEAANGETYTAQQPTQETPDEFKNIINCLLHLEGIDIEICGSWIWVTGETMKHKETLKELRFRWSKSKKAWYFHNEGYRKHNNKQFTLDEIRSLYGSEKIDSDPALKLQII